MALTTDQVRHIAKLARLELSEAEVEKYTEQLTGILGYVDMLKEVDTSRVEATAQVTGQSNVMRADEVRPPICEPDALLQCSPLPIVERQVQTQSAH